MAGTDNRRNEEDLEQLRAAIAAAKCDPHGGKVLLPLGLAETLLALAREQADT